MRVRRTARGALADLGPTLWVLFLLLTFPLLDLACVAIRYTFAMSASRDAAQAASTAKTFFSNLSSSELSAVNAADSQATTDAAAFTGVQLVSVNTNLVITNLNTSIVTRQTTPLTSPADTSNYLYQIEVVVTAKVYPLLTYQDKMFGTIPGLTGPAQFVVASTQMTENPSGMNQ